MRNKPTNTVTMENQWKVNKLTGSASVLWVRRDIGKAESQIELHAWRGAGWMITGMHNGKQTMLAGSSSLWDGDIFAAMEEAEKAAKALGAVPCKGLVIHQL
jgi:hypothetical protein